MMEIDLDRLRVLLAERSLAPQHWWLLRDGEVGARLSEARRLAADVDPEVRGQAWAALDRVVGEQDRGNFVALLVDGFDIDQFRRLLTDPDPQIRSRAPRIDTRGPGRQPFVTLTLDLLGDERVDYAWPDCIEVLRRPGNFTTLVEALTASPKGGLGERLWITLGLPGDTRVPEFLPEQSPPAMVSCPFSGDCADEDFVAAHRCRHLPIVSALLGSSLDNVRHEAISDLCVFGTGAVGALRSVPRSDRVTRRAAMTMLAEFGWNYLAPDDLTVLHRLIRMKQRTETPAPVDFQRLSGSWFALPTADHAAVLAAFDLRDPVAVTMRMGFAPWQGTVPLTMYPGYWTDLGFGADDSAPQSWDLYPEVFLTPVLDGWTLVFFKDTTWAAKPHMPTGEKQSEMYLRLEELSLRFGTAHWYEQFVDDYAPGCRSQWCIARDGAIRMHCVSAGQVRIRRSDEIDPDAPLDRLYAWLQAGDRRRATSEPGQVTAYLDMLREHAGEAHSPDDDEDLEPASALQDRVFGARSSTALVGGPGESGCPHPGPGLWAAGGACRPAALPTSRRTADLTREFRCRVRGTGEAVVRVRGWTGS
ncbi:hypothetical protein [Nocardia sp. NPDC057030]|uniref:hypothetical protein n=1 Tax=unclassified Nocardia TaxID=2637762 RepID=UPI00362A9EC6